VADVILFFASNADTMIATKALKDSGIVAKMIPKPATLSASANLCLSLDGSLESQAVAALSGANVALGGVAK
jgi:hypothetical protein